MPFKQFYTWIKYKTLPPSFLAKNRFFVERDSKKLRIFNNIGLTFRNERWTNWESSHVDWAWVDLFILITRYVGGFLFAILLWYFWADFFVDLPFFNKVAYKFWSAYDFCNYYSLYLVWILLLMRSFIWDTFIVVLFSGTAKHYYPLARREEAQRQIENQMPLVAKLTIAHFPFELKSSKWLIWTLLSSPRYYRTTTSLFNSTQPETSLQWLAVSRSLYRVVYMLDMLEKSFTTFNFYPPHSTVFMDNTFTSTHGSGGSNSPMFPLITPTTAWFYLSPFHLSHQPSPFDFISSKVTQLYSLNFVKLAKQQRLITHMTPVSPQSQITLSKLSVMKEFISSQGNWLKAEPKNIWLKSFNPQSVFNSFRFVEPFDSSRSWETHNFIKSGALTGFYDLYFSVEEPLVWQIKRLFLARPIQPLNFSAAAKSDLYFGTRTPSFKEMRGLNHINTALSQLVLPTDLKNSPRISPVYHVYANYPYGLENQWSLWSIEFANDLHQLYLMNQHVYKPFTYTPRPPMKRIYFRRS